MSRATTLNVLKKENSHLDLSYSTAAGMWHAPVHRWRHAAATWKLAAPFG